MKMAVGPWAERRPGRRQALKPIAAAAGVSTAADAGATLPAHSTCELFCPSIKDQAPASQNRVVGGGVTKRDVCHSKYNIFKHQNSVANVCLTTACMPSTHRERMDNRPM